MDFQETPLPEKLGRYVVEGAVGSGSMGAVLLGKDPVIGRPVAIKLIQISPQLPPEDLEKYKERFYREAKAAGKLLHPGIVTIFDVGHSDKGIPFIIMEYVEGRTLKSMIDAGELDLAQACKLAQQVLDAVGYAHSQGIVHRDIKPANILVTKDGHAKVMDFGIAHLEGSDFTHAGELLGTPNYMAPEQIEGRPIDHRTDLFAFGVMFYLMLTRERPFSGNSLPAISYAVINKDPIPPDQINPQLPSDLSRIVLRCLAKDPNRRYNSAGEVKEELAAMEKSLSAGPIEELEELIESEPDQKALDDSVKTIEPVNWWQKKKYRLAWIVALILLVLLTLILVNPGGQFPLTKISTLKDTKQRQNEELFEESKRAFEAGNLEESKARINELLKRNPDSPKAKELLVQVRHQETFLSAQKAFAEGKLEESRIQLEQLRVEDPGFAPASDLLTKVMDQQLFDVAKTAFEKRDFEKCLAKLQELLTRNPRFPGGADLQKNASEGNLFQKAKTAFDRGHLEESEARLQELIKTNPSFPSASELLQQQKDEEKWRRTLPMSFQARHKHRFGDCKGNLIFANDSVQYTSKEHGSWKWQFSHIREIVWEDSRHVRIQTFEKDLLNLGDHKDYRFSLLDKSIEDPVWDRYERLCCSGARKAR